MKKKVTLIFLGLIIALVSYEVLVRVYVSYLRAPQTDHNNLIEKDFTPNTIRILAIGESTTDLYWAEDNAQAWTIALERDLNMISKSKRYKVYNEGVGGTRTAIILSRLDHLLDTYKPHLVISMMGINDKYSSIRFEETWLNKLEILFQSLKITKLISRFFDNYPHDKFLKKDNYQIADQYYNKYILQKTNQRNIALAEIDKLSKKYPHLMYRFNFLIAESIILNKNFGTLKERSKEEDQRIALEYYQRSYDQTKELLKKNTSKDLLVNLIQVTVEMEKYEECVLTFKKAIEKGHSLSNFMLSRATLCYESLSDQNPKASLKDLKKLYKNLNITRNDKYNSYENTVHHYRALYDKLKKRDIKYVAMGYPLVDISVLKRMFSDNPEYKNFDSFSDAMYSPSPQTIVAERYKDIIFVSNKESFEEALKTGERHEYFNDDFAKLFGHTTPKGDRLIVDELLKVLSPILVD